MARLFITPREINFISDITKEIIKDVVGQKIYYYPVSEHKTQVRGVYNEAFKKVFDNPIAIDALVDSQYQNDSTMDQFGSDTQYKLEVFIQYRDMVEKGINIEPGDYFSFSTIFYEISQVTIMRNIYGLAEHKGGIKLVGTRARESLFTALTIGPTDISNSESDAVQHTFVQQRGFSENKEGITADVHDLVKNGVLDSPLTGPKEVSPLGDSPQVGSAFYDE